VTGDQRPVPEVPATDEIEALVRSLVGMMRGGGMTELDLAFGSVSIRLRGGSAPAPAIAGLPAVDPLPPPIPDDPGPVLTAPMIGTFYSSPSPGTPPFVEPGDAIAAGQIIGIIEAMKIMNEIPAETGGLVEEVLVANGQPVEFGTPLVRLHRGRNAPS
jgi:acetyl-CoA carboxylase biotin carboxyl carrier protein